MRCICLDFPDVDFINPAYAYKINVGYVLSDYLDIIGHTVFLLSIERRFQKMSLIHKAGLVAAFQINEPEAKQAFDDFFAQQKHKKSVKHLPTNLFVLSKKYELEMEKVVNNWIVHVQSMMKNAGFFSFYANFDKGIFENHYLVDNPEAVKDSSLLIDDFFSNKAPEDMVDKTIWLLAEGFYSKTIFTEGAVTDIDHIEEGKPYLIKCLDLPNLNALTLHEMWNLKDQVHEPIVLFKREADVWASKCYTEKGGMNYFKEHLMPMMPLVQATIENDSILKQWDTIELVKRTSSIYFGEVSPPMIWSYYKNALIIEPKLYDQLMADYITKESYTIPVMVFGYNREALTLIEESTYYEAAIGAVLSVKKHFEVE